MHLLIIPAGFILWYLAYDAKPKSNDEVTNLWEQDNIVKRGKLQNILEESCYPSE